MTCLSELTIVGHLSNKEFNGNWFIFYCVEQLDGISSGDYAIFVIEDINNRSIAASGTIFIEHKFIHKNGKVGHIEDIVVRKQYRA